MQPEVGLCGLCRHAHVQRSSKGSEFWRCMAADADERLLRYPPLPVARCVGYEPEEGAPGQAASPPGGKVSPTAPKKT